MLRWTSVAKLRSGRALTLRDNVRREESVSADSDVTGSMNDSCPASSPATRFRQRLAGAFGCGIPYGNAEIPAAAHEPDNQDLLNMTNTAIDKELDLLLRFRDAVGEIHGSEDLCMLLYAMVKREKPQVVLELGTGLGVSAGWIGRALLENGGGHLWTYDDGSSQESFLPAALNALSNIPEFREACLGRPNLADFVRTLFDLTGVADHVTPIEKSINLSAGMADILPQPVREGQTIDMLFSDFAHGPGEILDLTAAMLPHMSEYSSIFIDSASTYLLSFFMLEQVVEQLNVGKLPHRFTQGRDYAERQRLLQTICERRFKLVHLIENKDRAQNSTAWLKLEPVQWSPPPTARVR
jgi:hypothetical protein